MEWEVEYTDQFEEWWNTLDVGEQDDVAVKVELLKQHGPALGRPHADTIKTSRHAKGRDRWYQEYVPVADRLLDEHRETLRREARARHSEGR